MKLQHKIAIAMIVTMGFFGLELAVGMYTKSLALVSDSFHLFHDFAAQYIAFRATVLALKQKKLDDQETYGWHRASVIGGLVNGCCLASIVFMIILQAIERLIEPSPIHDPKMLLVVASLGFLINLFTLLVFHNHVHHHDVKKDEECGCDHEHGSHDQHQHEHQHGTHDHHIKGMILHIIGDLLGSVGVIIAGILYMCFPHWKYIVYLDPLISIFISIILGFSTINIIKSTIHILMQHCPEHVNIQKLRNEIEKVITIGDLHVWNLSDDKILGTVHGFTNRNQNETIKILKSIFHRHGIHATTIELIEESQEVWEPLLCQAYCDQKRNQCCPSDRIVI